MKATAVAQIPHLTSDEGIRRRCLCLDVRLVGGVCKFCGIDTV